MLPDRDDRIARSPAPARLSVRSCWPFSPIITCTFGNLAAYGQTNIKRLLAYSTIAHAGYMMMPVAAAMAAGRRYPAQPPRRHRGAGVLYRRVSVHEPGRVRRRGFLAERAA